ncbi:MAG: hypothetical protein IJ225_00225 [Solobacterium sp.]|nr:hypothetical protein [Solobacterium sp.]
MKNSSRSLFSHVYVEREIYDHPETSRILSRLNHPVIIPIERYTDVFNRPNQSLAFQTSHKNLILAKKHGTFLYPGAPVCHNFGNDRFFYTSTMINCLFDCEYCWLKGMYSSAFPVIFINTEEFLSHTERMLEEGPLYLSLSFETDLVPLETLTGHIHTWNSFITSHPGLTAEVRTKSGSAELYASLCPSDRMIFAFTLSPESLIRSSEHGTGSLSARISALKEASRCGFPVRICLDPIIRFPGWKDSYQTLVDQLIQEVDFSLIRDITIGTYRQSESYQRRMRKRCPDSVIIQYPYETSNGYCGYSKPKQKEAEQFLIQLLEPYVPREQIVRLEEDL